MSSLVDGASARDARPTGGSRSEPVGARRSRARMRRFGVPPDTISTSTTWPCPNSGARSVCKPEVASSDMGARRTIRGTGRAYPPSAPRHTEADVPCLGDATSSRPCWTTLKTRTTEGRDVPSHARRLRVAGPNIRTEGGAEAGGTACATTCAMASSIPASVCHFRRGPFFDLEAPIGARPLQERVASPSGVVAGIGGRAGGLRSSVGRRRSAAGSLFVGLLQVLFAWLVVPTSSARAQAPAPLQTQLTPPKLLAGPAPAYPEGATGEARIIVELVVAADGRVESAQAVSGGPPFAQVAEAAVATYRFEPAQRAGVPVRARVRMLVAFAPPAPPQAPPPAAASATSAASTTPEAKEARPPEEVSITGRRYETQTPTEHRMGRAEVRLIPGAFGDPFRAIEILPGVTPTLSGLPYYYVRGAPPSAVGYYVDEVRVPYLFHFGLGPGVIEPALVREVTLHPAAFPGRFGRFAGAIVAGETKDPPSKLQGESTIRVYDAGAFVETPLANGRATVGLGGRVSYSALLLSLVVPEATVDYRDYNARFSVRLSDRTKLTAFAFGSYDYAASKSTSTKEENVLFASEFHRLDVRLDHEGDKSHSRIAATVGLDRTNLEGSRFARDHVLGLRARHREILSEAAEIEVGTDVSFDFFDADLPNPYSVSRKRYNSAVAFFSPRTESTSGAWVSALLRPTKKTEVSLTARADVFTSAGAIEVGPSPRAAVRVPVVDHVAGLFALGIAPQAPAFSIPLPAVGFRGLPGGLSYAYQKSAGVEVELPLSFTATAVGFHHSYANLRDILQNVGTKIDPYDAAITANPQGQAFGLELLLKRKLTRRFSATLSYTLSRSTLSSTRDRPAFVNPFDRAHVFQGAVAFDLTHGWLMSSRAVIYSGWPDKGGIASGAARRLPPFFRFDARIEKRWRWGKDGHISFLLEGLNVTASKDIVTQTCSTTTNTCETESIGPLVIPSIGVEGAI
jgi:hypothetical protein